jgi:LysR family transcriptional regulator, benzoate and cis,cis-muconate-responsive activator of ben and cat genes
MRVLYRECEIPFLLAEHKPSDMLGRMELRHLRYFVAVADEQNISRAALKLHISQPPLSRTVRELEDEIGFKLFERSAKSIKLTQAGRMFLIEARGVLQSAADAVSKTRKAVNLYNGELNIGYAPSLALQIIPQTLRTFQTKFPKVRVTLHDLSTGEMLSRLREEKLQLAITSQLPARFLHGLKTAQVARHPISIAVAPKHPLAKSKSVTLERLALEPLSILSPKDYPESEEMFGKVFARVKRKPQIVSEYDSITSIIAEVEARRGFAFVPTSLRGTLGVGLKFIRPIPALSVAVVAIWRKGSETEALQYFITSARQKLGSPRKIQ